MNNNQNNGFQYSYSAKDRKEIEKIREKYLTDTKSPELDKMEQIRRLDSDVTKKATTIALIVGVIGTLVMGLGMSLIMTDLKEILGSYVERMAMPLGIIIGLVGMVAVIVAYPLYQYISENKRKKTAPEILRLAEELLNEKE